MLNKVVLSGLVLLLSSTASTTSLSKRRVPAITFHEPTALEVTSNHVALQRSHGPSRKSRRPGLRNAQLQDTSNTAPLTSIQNGQAFLVPLDFGGNHLQAALDTGSSDTWFARAGFNCVDASGNRQDASICNFGPLINGTFDGGSISNTHLNISYTGGEFMNGVFGYENITMAGVTVKQEVALVNYAHWEGDGISSGLVGFSYPALTAAYNGTNTTEDGPANRKSYDPIFTSMFKLGLIKPMFSLAINRDTASPGGYLALGGLPPVNYSGDFTSTPILLSQDPATGNEKNIEYMIKIDAYTYGSTTIPTQPGQTSTQAVIDSGAFEVALPVDVSKAVNAAFSPPAQFLADKGAYLVACNATAPSLSITINGTAFALQPADLIDQSNADNSTGLCPSSVQDADVDDESVLGATFLKNVVAVFDVGAGQMRFAQRTD